MAGNPLVALMGKPLDINQIDADIAQTTALENRNKLFDMQVAQQRQAAEQEAAVNQLYKRAMRPDGSIDQTQLLTGMAQGGQGSKIPGLQKQFAELDKSRSDTEKARLEAAGKQLEMIGQVFGPVLQNPALYPQALAYARQQIPGGGADLPDQYDEATVKGMLQRALSAKEQIEQTWKQKNFDLDVEKFGETKRHNRTQEGISYGNLAVSRDRLALDKRESSGGMGKAPAGYRWKADGSGMEPIPGGPADKQAAATEGERKSATLLKRMEGSLQQLNSALKKNPDAAKPELLGAALGKINEGAGNAATSEARQRVEAAQLDILDAALTLGTGAAYTREQLEGYRKSYFPQIGDKPENVREKQARLQNILEAARISAGRAAPQASPAKSGPNIDDLLKKYGG